MFATLVDKNKFICSIVLMLLASDWSLGQTLSQKIDAEVAKPIADFEKKAAPLCSDLEFIRRVTLDLIGTIPTVEQSREFVKSTNANKRSELVDALLASPAHAWYLSLIHI